MIRKAGSLIGKLFGTTFSKKNADYLLPDVLFGGMSGLATMGDGADKMIAGGSDFMLSALAGGAARNLPFIQKLGPKAVGAADMTAGILGANAGMAASDGILRMRHGGMTPAEKAYAQEIDLIKQQAADEAIGMYLGGF
jgi:hypothetical protein